MYMGQEYGVEEHYIKKLVLGRQAKTTSHGHCSQVQHDMPSHNTSPPHPSVTKLWGFHNGDQSWFSEFFPKQCSNLVSYMICDSDKKEKNSCIPKWFLYGYTVSFMSVNGIQSMRKKGYNQDISSLRKKKFCKEKLRLPCNENNPIRYSINFFTQS